MALDALKVFAVGPVGKLQRVRAAKKPFGWPKQGGSERLAQAGSRQGLLFRQILCFLRSGSVSAQAVKKQTRDRAERIGAATYACVCNAACAAGLAVGRQTNLCSLAAFKNPVHNSVELLHLAGTQVLSAAEAWI